MKEFLSCLPESYRNSPETVDLLRGIQEAAGLLREQSHSFLQQAQVSTASWGLSLWEDGYGVPVDVSKSQQERREVLYARMRAVGSVTPAMIQNIAAAFSDGNTTLEEFFQESRFHLTIDRNIASQDVRKVFEKAIEEVKPAHLAWNYSIQVINPVHTLHIAGGFYTITETILPPLEGVSL